MVRDTRRCAPAYRSGSASGSYAPLPLVAVLRHRARREVPLVQIQPDHGHPCRLRTSHELFTAAVRLALPGMRFIPELTPPPHHGPPTLGPRFNGPGLADLFRLGPIVSFLPRASTSSAFCSPYRAESRNGFA